MNRTAPSNRPAPGSSGRLGQRARAAGWLFLVACCCWGAAVRAAGIDHLEYKVKAGYLFNFAKYVEWPPRAHASMESPFVIGVLGEEAVVNVIAEVLQFKTVFERPLEVRAVTRLDQRAGCHILFITRDARITPGQAAAAVGSDPVLLVGETESFAEAGGMIAFVRQDERFRLLLNLESVNAAGLKASSKLSSVARRVQTKKGGPP